ncbi:hypothetical protein ACFLZZ_01135 [Nanoarchaeota archaeon]
MEREAQDNWFRTFAAISIVFIFIISNFLMLIPGMILSSLFPNIDFFNNNILPGIWTVAIGLFLIYLLFTKKKLFLNLAKILLGLLVVYAFLAFIEMFFDSTAALGSMVGLLLLIVFIPILIFLFMSKKLKETFVEPFKQNKTQMITLIVTLCLLIGGTLVFVLNEKQELSAKNDFVLEETDFICPNWRTEDDNLTNDLEYVGFLRVSTPPQINNPKSVDNAEVYEIGAYDFYDNTYHEGVSFEIATTHYSDLFLGPIGEKYNLSLDIGLGEDLDIRKCFDKENKNLLDYYSLVEDTSNIYYCKDRLFAHSENIFNDFSKIVVYDNKISGISFGPKSPPMYSIGEITKENKIKLNDKNKFYEFGSTEDLTKAELVAYLGECESDQSEEALKESYLFDLD